MDDDHDYYDEDATTLALASTMHEYRSSRGGAQLPGSFLDRIAVDALDAAARTYHAMTSPGTYASRVVAEGAGKAIERGAAPAVHRALGIAFEGAYRAGLACLLAIALWWWLFALRTWRRKMRTRRTLMTAAEGDPWNEAHRLRLRIVHLNADLVQSRVEAETQRARVRLLEQEQQRLHSKQDEDDEALLRMHLELLEIAEAHRSNAMARKAAVRQRFVHDHGMAPESFPDLYAMVATSADIAELRHGVFGDYDDDDTAASL